MAGFSRESHLPESNLDRLAFLLTDLQRRKPGPYVQQISFSKPLTVQPAKCG